MASPIASEAQQRRKPKMVDPVASSSPTASSSATASRRGSPYLPTSRETLLLAIFPTFLLFGTLFSVLSPQTRAAEVAAAPGTAHYLQSPGLAPSYFARKDNILNVFFVKRGWFWITVTFAFFVTTHPFYAAPTTPQKNGSSALLGRRPAAILRWGLVTGWWFLVTQWFFGPALVDRNFRLTGGGCQALQAAMEDNVAANKDPSPLLLAATASACKHAGGQWRGGHDISGHVFLLVLGTTFLAQEIGWVLWRRAAGASSTAGRVADTRSLIMYDGAVKSAEVEASLVASSPTTTPSEFSTAVSRIALRFAAGVVGLCLWMLLMTAIYFHTWFEKLTGLLVALTGFYSVYVLPRWVPALRRIVGVPGL
ncbi:hypothetical protein SEUCBS140593_009763 [Sporothrix eucalyptigena]|uniref:Acyl-coenzyme A diphosphatase SCS3 n=1 Tax=Sporothrix eucalyptigena TaxID=1812306 RepID=A0ABP0CXJ3_9PEZI